MRECSSSPALMGCGVPQESILGLITFCLYMLGSIFKKHQISFHCYADDISIYFPFSLDVSAPLQPLLNCLQRVKDWFSWSDLNKDKTEDILFSNCSLDTFLGILGLLHPYSSSVIKHFGVFFNSTFKFDKQTFSVVETSFFQFGLIAKVKSYIPPKTFKHLYMPSSPLDWTTITLSMLVSPWSVSLQCCYTSFKKSLKAASHHSCFN